MPSGRVAARRPAAQARWPYTWPAHARRVRPGSPDADHQGPSGWMGLRLTQPRTRIPPARSAGVVFAVPGAASAEATSSVSILSPCFKPFHSRPDRQVQLTHGRRNLAPPRSLEWPAGVGRHSPPGDGRQRGCAYGLRVCSVAATEDRSVSGLPSVPRPQAIYPSSLRGAPDPLSSGRPQGVLRWIRAKGKPWTPAMPRNRCIRVLPQGLFIFLSC